MPAKYRPVTIGVGNAASVSTGPAKARDTFRNALDHDRVDLWLFVECADFDAHAVASPERWSAEQVMDNEATQGVVIAKRWGRGLHLRNTRLRLGSHATREGGGIRDRFILAAMLVVDDADGHAGWAHAMEVGHAPPPRAPRARARFMARFAQGPAIKGGDLNLPERAVARITGRRVVGVGVMHLVIPRRFRVLATQRIKHGSDHTAVAVTIAPR